MGIKKPVLPNRHPAFCLLFFAYLPPGRQAAYCLLLTAFCLLLFATHHSSLITHLSGYHRPPAFPFQAKQEGFRFHRMEDGDRLTVFFKSWRFFHRTGWFDRIGLKNGFLRMVFQDMVVFHRNFSLKEEVDRYWILTAGFSKDLDQLLTGRLVFPAGYWIGLDLD